MFTTSRNNKLLLCLLVALMLIPAYVLSILWRVSLAEQEDFGHSTLIPVAFPVKKFSDPATPETWWSKSYIFDRRGRKVLVWNQEINGFQHIYGSALASFELGDTAADYLFRANEFAEAFCDWNGITWQDILDRRKDLAHNKLGRSIGTQARERKLSGSAAQAFIENSVLEAMDQDVGYYPSFLDPRVQSLREDAFGCALLPRYNQFNYLLPACGVHDEDADVSFKI